MLTLAYPKIGPSAVFSPERKIQKMNPFQYTSCEVNWTEYYYRIEPNNKLPCFDYFRLNLFYAVVFKGRVNEHVCTGKK